MLSESGDEKHNDIRLQDNLQRDLAKVTLSLASVPLPRICTFRIDDAGYLRLDNRPLSIQMTIQANEGIPIPDQADRQKTFSRVSDFVLHFLEAFDSRFLYHQTL